MKAAKTDNKEHEQCNSNESDLTPLPKGKKKLNNVECSATIDVTRSAAKEIKTAGNLEYSKLVFPKELL